MQEVHEVFLTPTNLYRSTKPVKVTFLTSHEAIRPSVVIIYPEYLPERTVFLIKFAVSFTKGCFPVSVLT